MNKKRGSSGKGLSERGSTIHSTKQAAVKVEAMGMKPHELKVGESTDGTGFRRQMAVEEKWSGPLPPPKQLADFEAIKPGLADRIVCMAEEEGAHTRLVEKRALNWTIVAQLIGQFFAAGLAAGCLWVSYLLAMAGHDWIAGILGGTTLTTVVLAFLGARRSKFNPDSDTDDE